MLRCARCAVSQRGVGSVSGQCQSAKDQKKRLRALFFRPRFLPALSPLVLAHQAAFPTACAPALFCTPAFGHFLPSREGFNYNTGHFGAGKHRGATRHQAGVTPQLPSRDLFMKFIVWLIRVLVFVLLLVLALSNTQPATLNFLAGYAWSAPLILIGLAFFVVGLLAGLVSSMPAVVRLRMENGRLKRELRVAREAPVAVEQPPMPPLI